MSPPDSLPVLSGRDVCAVLSRHGFVKARQKGSHIIMQKRTESSTLTIPVPNYRELKRGTLLSIIRQSRLEKSAFRR